MEYIREGLLSERFLRLRFVAGGGAYFSGGLILNLFGGVGGWERGAYYQEFYGMPSIFSNILN